MAGVGVWQYIDAGHVGVGYVGSAEVCLRSDRAGESLGGIYDVFTADADASAEFDVAYASFQRYSPAGSFQVLHLNPPVDAFCSPQVSASTTICWFVRGLATGIVTATIPSAAYGGEGQAVLHAMLTHLIALGG